MTPAHPLKVGQHADGTFQSQVSQFKTIVFELFPQKILTAHPDSICVLFSVKPTQHTTNKQTKTNPTMMITILFSQA